MAAEETASHIGNMNANVPDGTNNSLISNGDDELRKVKSILLTDFANITGAVTATHTELNYLAGVTLGTGAASKALTVSAGSAITCAGLTWTNLGTVTTAVITSADINGGTWQGTIDGNWTAAGQTCADLGTVSDADFTQATLGGSAAMTGIETDLSSSASATKLATAASVKTYADSLNQGMTIGTAAAASSGTTVSETLSGTVERIEIAFWRVSNNNTNLFIRLGTGGTLATTGYEGNASDPGSNNSGTVGFPVNSRTNDACDFSGIATLTRVFGNNWVISGTTYDDQNIKSVAFAGEITLGGPLNIVGLYSSSGFDGSGYWRVSYQTS